MLEANFYVMLICLYGVFIAPADSGNRLHIEYLTHCRVCRDFLLETIGRTVPLIHASCLEKHNNAEIADKGWKIDRKKQTVASGILNFLPTVNDIYAIISGKTIEVAHVDHACQYLQIEGCFHRNLTRNLQRIMCLMKPVLEPKDVKDFRDSYVFIGRGDRSAVRSHAVNLNRDLLKILKELKNYIETVSRYDTVQTFGQSFERKPRLLQTIMR